MRLILSQFYAFIAILTILRNIKVTASSSFEKSTSGLVSINAYPFGSIASCKQIPQAAVNYCGLNYKTAASSANLAPELTLVIYHILMVITNLPNIQASDQCVQNVKHLYCGLVFPRCDASKSQITFNTTNCYEATGACSSVVNSVIRRIKLCQFAPHGNFELDTCVKPPTISYLHCPSNPNLVTVPKYLILNRILVDVATTYDVDLLRDKGATEQCIQNYVNLLCQSIPFCSPDKKSLMTTVTKEMCYNAVNW
ncbi:hypothetical protein TrispH2_004610 [Trichoplax sp. H2]|nr:hypothetical protein TrispH2_004610 [Trichoplax sp. H2]|eukprot:RDD44246.1 hypothetical protein TrispH2_004610 [Trichoplax sp. H2]